MDVYGESDPQATEAGERISVLYSGLGHKHQTEKQQCCKN